MNVLIPLADGIVKQLRIQGDGHGLRHARIKHQTIAFAACNSRATSRHRPHCACRSRVAPVPVIQFPAQYRRPRLHQSAKIDSFTVKQRLARETLDNAHYQGNQPQAAPANLLEFPNLRIELATVSAETWRTWFRSFVIDGNSSAMNEKHPLFSRPEPDHGARDPQLSKSRNFPARRCPARCKRGDNARCGGPLL